MVEKCIHIFFTQNYDSLLCHNVVAIQTLILKAFKYIDSNLSTIIWIINYFIGEQV